MLDRYATRWTIAVVVVGLAACSGSSSTAPALTVPPTVAPAVTTIAATSTVAPTTVPPTTAAPTTVPGPKASPVLPEGAPFYNNLEPDHVERTKQWIAVERWLYLDTRRYGPVTQLLVDPRGPSWTIDADIGEKGRNVPQRSDAYADPSTFEVGEEDGRILVAAIGISRGGESRALNDDRVLVKQDPDAPMRYSVVWSQGENGEWLIWARSFEVGDT
jgi:hypothetical protein